ncbi:MAG TPA: SMC-Scp complex subunit ScpB [Rhodanobacteraceae bacterium]
MADINQIKRIFEAALFGAGQPLALPQLAALFDEQDMPSHEEISRALEELQADSEGRGVELVEVASGFRYQVREEVHPFVSRLWTERQTRYSRALLETLALIAYRQPITRAEIEQIRGVGVATSIVKTLEEREWVRVVGYRDLPGKPALLGTTRAFLDYFNLKSLDQLPPLSDIRELEDIDPQLALATDGKIPATLADEPDLAFADSGERATEMPAYENSSPDDSVAAHAVRDDTPEPAA